MPIADATLARPLNAHLWRPAHDTVLNALQMWRTTPQAAAWWWLVIDHSGGRFTALRFDTLRQLLLRRDLGVTMQTRLADLPPAQRYRLVVTVAGQPAQAGPDGADRVEFGLVAHQGAAPLPIAKSASGGELSRVMLALEVVLAEPDSGGVMVFDEVDAGVGGAAAVQIGARLARLARRHQVIVVTHLPQVAAFADQHLVIGKTGGGSKGRQTSTLSALDRDERIAELARMLAGLGDSDTGRAHAEELLATAEAARSEA